MDHQHSEYTQRFSTCKTAVIRIRRESPHMFVLLIRFDLIAAVDQVNRKTLHFLRWWLVLGGTFLNWIPSNRIRTALSGSLG